MTQMLLRADLREELKYTMDMKDIRDICITYHRQQKEFGVMNREELESEIKKWRKMRKEGDLIINPKNHRSPIIFGKQYYTLSLQQLTNGEYDNIGLDLLSLVGGDDSQFHVNGITYAFKKVENRDMVYKYVMGLK